MTKEEKRILKQFVAYPTPKHYLELDAQGNYTHEGLSYDLMYCCEDLFHYAWCALHKRPIDTEHNFVNVPSQGLTQGFSDCLWCIGQENGDLMEFCALCISVIDLLLNLRFDPA